MQRKLGTLARLAWHRTRARARHWWPTHHRAACGALALAGQAQRHPPPSAAPGPGSSPRDRSAAPRVCPTRGCPSGRAHVASADGTSAAAARARRIDCVRIRKQRLSTTRAAKSARASRGQVDVWQRRLCRLAHTDREPGLASPPLGTCDLSRSPGASARSWALRVARRCQAVRSPPRQWRELWSVLRLSATGHAHTRPRQTAARARAEARPGASQPPERPLQGLKRGAHTCCGAPETRAVLSSSSCRTTRRKQRRCPRTGGWPACASRRTRRRGASPVPAKASARAADAVGLGRSGTPHRPRSPPATIRGRARAALTPL